jgi:hypothetical protein
MGKVHSTCFVCTGCNGPLGKTNRFFEETKRKKKRNLILLFILLFSPSTHIFLAGGYLDRGGQPYCTACANKGPKVTTTTVTTGQRQQGFVIDPRTGQKRYV